MTAYGDTTRYLRPEQRPGDTAPLNGGRLWAGGVASALVAAGVAFVGYLFVRGLLGIPILRVRASGAVVQPTMIGYAAAAAVAAIAATGLIHLLLATTPRPRAFFGWIVGLATVVAMLMPLALEQPLSARVATGLVNLAIGVAVGILVDMSATASLRATAPPERGERPASTEWRGPGAAPW